MLARHLVTKRVYAVTVLITFCDGNMFCENYKLKCNIKYI